MINLNKLQRVYLVGPEGRFHTLKKSLKESLKQLGGKSEIHFYQVPTNGIQLDGTENPEQQREALYGLVSHLNTNFDGDLSLQSDSWGKPDPVGTLIVIDSAHKAANTLAQLLEKPWKGFPFEAQTIVV